jgi:divalent metal cation (Fe/Co/Zn/Cd) transporter
MEAAALSRSRLIRRGVGLEVFTLAWMSVEAAVAIGSGIAAGSVALLAFGIDSVIEFVAAWVVLREFRAEQAGLARPDGERRAVRVIAVTFFLLAVYIAVDAAYTLLSASKPEQSVLGLAVAAAALLVMPTLALLKRRTGKLLGSEALLADAAESAFCAYLSGVVLVGVGLNAAFGWWWADPIAALLVIPLVLKEGMEALEED